MSDIETGPGWALAALIAAVAVIVVLSGALILGWTSLSMQGREAETPTIQSGQPDVPEITPRD